MARPDELTDVDRRFLGEYLNTCDNDAYLVIKILIDRLDDLMREHKPSPSYGITLGLEQSYREALGEDADEAIEEHKELIKSWRSAAMATP